MKDIAQETTESVCPVCLGRVKARRSRQGDDVVLEKECPDHGLFSTVVWRGKPLMAEWQRPKDIVHPPLCYSTVERGCPFDCGLCADHRQLPCSVLLEITDRCNLRCAFCFADSRRVAGVPSIEKSIGADIAGPPYAPPLPKPEERDHLDEKEPSLDLAQRLLERAIAAAGPTNLQLSGGEPTLRDDLPEIVRIARQVGYSFIQVNSNGLRLALDRDFVKRLRDAGLSSVFLQFDGFDDEINRTMRGRRLLKQKLKALRNCGDAGIGVVLVPTLVKGVNTDRIGSLVKGALELTPAVRGIHFQPVSYFGRFPITEGAAEHFTLPELMRALEEQTAGLVKVTDFSPPGTEHAHCSFHATYIQTGKDSVRLVGAAQGTGCCAGRTTTGGVRQTIETVSRRWRLPREDTFLTTLPFPGHSGACCPGEAGTSRPEEALDLDTFLRQVSAQSFTISAMAFQDAYTLDLERLRGCCISVVSSDGRLIPFCAYNLTGRDGKSLYRPTTWSAGS